MIVTLIGTAAVYAIVYYLIAEWAAISIPLFSAGILIADKNKEVQQIVHSWRLYLLVLVITELMLFLYAKRGNLYLHCLVNWYVIFGLTIL